MAEEERVPCYCQRCNGALVARQTRWRHGNHKTPQGNPDDADDESSSDSEETSDEEAGEDRVSVEDGEGAAGLDYDRPSKRARVDIVCISFFFRFYKLTSFYQGYYQ
jgi:hypothetical protein